MPKHKSGAALVHRARVQMARVRAREKLTTNLAIEKATGIGAAVGIAAVETKIPLSIIKVPTKIWLAALAYVGSAMTKGALSKALESVGDAASHVYAYKASAQVRDKQASPLIAGEDEV
jgi:hypothetical protein